MSIIDRLITAFKRWQIKVGARCVCGSTATEPWGTKFATCMNCGRRMP